MLKTPKETFILPQKSKAARSIKMGVQKHFTGSIVCGDGAGEIIKYESHTERQTALVMLARREVVMLESQIPFGWIDQDGKARTHFFDFRISLHDGSRVALIVKNSRKAAKPEFVAEMRCLAIQAKGNVADRVSLITEAHLDPIEVHNAELIHGVRFPDPETDAAVQTVVAGIIGAARIEDIATAAGCPGRGFLAVVRMIQTHELELVAHEYIEPAALVRRRPV